MTYQEISKYRAMRLIAEGKFNTLYYQTFKLGELRKLTDSHWTIKELSNAKFFELTK